MITKYSNIVNIDAIGKPENPVALNDILKLASREHLIPSEQDKERVLFLAIDVQQDFMDNGALGVSGANSDVRRVTQFIYDNMESITEIAVSIDTHTPHQIFHSCWWVDKDGNNPAPYTLITLEDLQNGKWSAVSHPDESMDYVRHLEEDGKKTLCIWPYHCIQGTSGCALENQFANIAYFHSVARNITLKSIIKGLDPLSEMYGVIKPEYDKEGYVNTVFLNELQNYDKIIIAGEAKSHCVLESVKQILKHYEKSPEITQNIYILEDCMSPISGFEDATDAAFAGFKEKYGINIVKSSDKIF